MIEEPKCLLPCFHNILSSQSCLSDLEGAHKAAEATPAHPCSPKLEAPSVLLLDELVRSMGLELPLPAVPALLCRRALGHKNSQDQLV